MKSIHVFIEFLAEKTGLTLYRLFKINQFNTFDFIVDTWLVPFNLFSRKTK